MRKIDLHCDTISLLLEQGKELYSNDLNVSIEKLQADDVICQLFAMFVRMSEFASVDEAYAHVKKMHAVYVREMEQNPRHIRPARSAAELDQNLQDGVISGILTVEEGGVLGNDISRLDELYQMGVRLITLTWNFENSLGYPNSDEPEIMNAGLKPFGLEVVRRMNELGMLIDVSHLSDGGFWDVAQHSRAPFVASHSNARAVRDFRRNLTDEQLKKLSECGGVTGINFFHKFLGYDETGSIAQMVEHIRHIRKVAGMDVLALGSDFDGFSGPCEIADASQLHLLTDALHAGGFSDDEIEQFCSKNALRLLRSVL